jgi:hypothetical protein
MKMVKVTAGEWACKLRSGEYVQGTDCLKSNGVDSAASEFCCLGVLADMAGATWVSEVNRNTKAASFDDGSLVHGTCFPTRLVKQAFKDVIPAKVLGDIVEPICETLANMNDGGKTFDEIANYIELIPTIYKKAFCS